MRGEGNREARMVGGKNARLLSMQSRQESCKKRCPIPLLNISAFKICMRGFGLFQQVSLEPHFELGIRQSAHFRAHRKKRFPFSPVLNLHASQKLLNPAIQFICKGVLLHIVLPSFLRKVSSPRNWSCLTAPSLRPNSSAISRMLRCSIKRRTITMRCSGKSDCTNCLSMALRSISLVAPWSQSSASCSGFFPSLCQCEHSTFAAIPYSQAMKGAPCHLKLSMDASA